MINLFSVTLFDFQKIFPFDVRKIQCVSESKRSNMNEEGSVYPSKKEQESAWTNL